MPRTRRWTGCLAVAIASVPALGQDDTAPLAGPAVERETTPESLVEVAYDGSVEPLEAAPAEAAVELLGLDEATLAQVREVIAERAAILDRIVIENIELLVELQSARDDPGRRRAIYAEIVGKLAPLVRRGELEDEIGALLSEEQRRCYVSLIAEYERALEAQARAEAERRGERFRAWRYRARHRLEALGAELRRSYERQIGARQADLERLLRELALDPEREAEVRRIVTEFAQRTMLNPSRADRAGLFIEIMGVLTPEQRARAAARLRGDTPEDDEPSDPPVPPGR